MPETITDAFRDEKNKKENTPIILYEVTKNDATILRLCEWDQPITYGGETYMPFPLRHEGVGMNTAGEIDVVKITICNINREIASIIIANDGLIGNKVVIKIVFYNLLSDPNANISVEYWIDSVDVEEGEAVFTLTSKLDLYQIQCPNRIMERDHCTWTFKKEGCWIWGGSDWVARWNFVYGDVECDHTRDGPEGCRYHHPHSAGVSSPLPFGGFPGIPKRGIYVS